VINDKINISQNNIEVNKDLNIETDEKEKIPVVIIDERERGPIREYLKEIGHDTQIKTLDVGDFVLSEKVAVERKRGDDFAA
jgi:ERCC4-type nuclease